LTEHLLGEHLDILEAVRQYRPEIADELARLLIEQMRMSRWI
jgi:DNA-binding GntR family transcriptional regulator